MEVVLVTYLERPDEISKLKPTTLTHGRATILLLVRHIVVPPTILTFLLLLLVDHARWSVALGCAKQSNLVNGLLGDDHCADSRPFLNALVSGGEEAI